MSEAPAAGSRRGRRALIAVIAAAVLLGLAWKPASTWWRIYRPVAQDLPLAPALWARDSAKGAPLTARNAKDADLAPLDKHFQSQVHGSYCGVASAVIGLRALGKAGVSQQGFFTDAAAKVRSEREVFYGGMSLEELAGLLRAHGAGVRVVHAGDSSVEAFREEARANVERAGDVVLINYLRKSIEQKTGGHISPLGAYDAETDRFLVLDVSTYKYPPVWVQTAALYKAMNTVDKGAGKTRGWLHMRLAANDRPATPAQPASSGQPDKETP